MSSADFGRSRPRIKRGTRSFRRWPMTTSAPGGTLRLTDDEATGKMWPGGKSSPAPGSSPLTVADRGASLRLPNPCERRVPRAPHAHQSYVRGDLAHPRSAALPIRCRLHGVRHSRTPRAMEAERLSSADSSRGLRSRSAGGAHSRLRATSGLLSSPRTEGSVLAHPILSTIRHSWRTLSRGNPTSRRCMLGAQENYRPGFDQRVSSTRPSQSRARAPATSFLSGMIRSSIRTFP
jgi:hypothetical protein